MEGKDKPLNEIRIGMNTRVRAVVRYSNNLLNEKNFKDLHFSAVGGAIGQLVSAVEILKIVNSGLYQVFKIGTVSYQTVDNSDKLVDQRLYPKAECTLTLTPPKEKTEGYQEKLSEEERNKLFELHSRQRPRGISRDEEMGPKRGGRGTARGGPRGGYVERGAPRGGFGRGAPRGFGGQRGGMRGFEGPRGGTRGFEGPRGGTRSFEGPRRGTRGAPRGFGGPRGGMRGARGRGGF